MSYKYTTVAAIAFGAAVLPNLASAQDGARLQKKEVGADGQPTLLEFRAASRPSAADGAFVLREQLSLGQDEQMRPARVETDQLGFTHQKFDQYYKGVKIEHATYTVHARSGAVESLTGDYEKVDKLDVTPGLSASAALGRALAAVGAKKFMWQDAAEEANLKQQTGNPAATYQPQGELVIVRDFRVDPETGPLVLAWKFDIYAQAPVSRAYYYVNAQTGDVVLRDAIIKHATTAVPATFTTAYSGTRSLANEIVPAPGSGYRLRDYTRGSGIETYNLKKGTTYNNVDFVDADNVWTAAEYNNANYDNVAGDAHFGAQSTYDYWKAIHGRNSYNNAGAKILSYVHYSTNYENAYWDGARMTYGDGYTTFKPLAALDVCGHEIGHAVCSSTANLTYSNESGALNEGLSDCWGASVEDYTASQLGLTGKSTWDIGEEIMKAGNGVALRSMSNPSKYNQPAYYKGAKWYTGTADNGGVHTNSGVLNYWYYLVSVGKSGTNEASNAYSVTGIGLTDAAKILFRAESVYLTSSATYATARTATISAATDLFGATSTQTQAVTNAWYAVGVGAAYSGTTPPTTTTYCTSKSSSVAYGYIDYVKLGSITRTSAADGGYYDGTATTTSVAAGSSQSISYSAGFAGSAYSEYFKIYADWNQDGDFGDTGETLVSASASTATRSSTFTVPSTAKNGKTRLRVVMSTASSTTSCGSYSYGETEDYSLTVTGGTTTIVPAGLTATTAALDAGAEFSLYPNPATDQLQLSLSSGADVKSVEVLDVRGAKASVHYLGNGEVNVSGLAPGLYLLRASDGQNTFVKHFSKQ